MPRPRHLGGNHLTSAKLSKTTGLTLSLASDLGMERGSQSYQDMLKRVGIILEHNQERMRTLADEELATERRNEPSPVREVRSLIGKTKRKLGLEISGNVQVSY